jgi:hypothetical protein
MDGVGGKPAWSWIFILGKYQNLPRYFNNMLFDGCRLHLMRPALFLNSNQTHLLTGPQKV